LNYAIIDVGGISYKVRIPVAQEKLPQIGENIEVFTYLHIREGGADLYGFFKEDELNLFELLISVSGVGPKSAMAILSVSFADKLRIAIATGEPDLLRRSSGVGRKTAERIIVELRDKVGAVDSKGATALAESDQDVYEALLGLGYQRKKIEDVLREISPEITDVRDRLKEALKKIKG
ncbi:Holliday junction branch migration protein RuvA, partial [Patescibacteria group bacterium]|nr:Holliday junction branch migration protein RuvA [Patescibacteria group bacterium]